MGLDSSYPFALESITLITPSGTAGKADLTIQSSVGTATAANAFQYLTSSQMFPNAALHKFVTYTSRVSIFISLPPTTSTFSI